MDNTIFISQNNFSKDKPFQLEFRQLKEYFNFRRRFKTDKIDTNKQGITFPQDYYLIDKNWLNKWKEFVGYNNFVSFDFNREVKDSDYNTFIKNCLPANKNEIKLSPLDNSNIYNSQGEINPLAEFIIIDKKCQEVFGESRQNMAYNIIEKPVPLTFFNDKIIIHINNNTKLFCFRDDMTNKDMEIIIIFTEQGNNAQIYPYICKENLKYWLKDKGFQMDGPDELEVEEQGCKMKIINKNLKLNLRLAQNKVVIDNQFKSFEIPNDLKAEMQTKVLEIYKKTGIVKEKINTNIKSNNYVNNNKNNQNPVLNTFNNNAQNNNFNNNNYNNNYTPQFNNNQNNQNQFNINFNNNQFNNMNYNFNKFNGMNNPMNMNNFNNMNYQNGMNNLSNMNNFNNNNNFNMNNNIYQPNTPCQMNMQMQMGMQNMNNINYNPNMQMLQMNQINMNYQNSNNRMVQCNPNFLNLGLGKNNSSPNFTPNMELNSKSNTSQNPLTAGISYPHQAGLFNVGQSCYMNATIECLSNIKDLSNKLLRRYGTFDIDKQPLCVSYSSLLYDLLHTKEKSIRPILFKQIIGKLNPLFEGNHAADAKDLIFYIIETLHKELQTPNPNKNNIEINFAQQEIDAQNEQKMLKDFFAEFDSNKTIISDIFYGINRSIMKCNTCTNIKYSFQTFNLLIFPLRKIKEFKEKNRSFKIFRGLDLNLYDAFLCEQEEEKLEGENMIYCNNCRQLTPGIHKQDFYTLPPILIIILNRGKNNQDFNEEFRFDEILDFTDKNIVQNSNSYKKYYLGGIITHLGESGSSGHFIAYCRNNPNENFVCYNDDNVCPVNVQDAMSAKISYEAMEKKTPYILLYHYMN